MSWCNIQVWFSHNAGLFLRTASLKRVKTSWYNCILSDHVVQIHDGQCLSNQKTQPTTLWSLTDSSSPPPPRGDPFPIHCDDCIWFQHHTNKPKPNFAAKLDTHTLFFKLFHCHFVTNPTNSLCTCSVQRV